MKKLLAGLLLGSTLIAAAPAVAAEKMMDDPKTMAAMKKGMDEMDKAMAMMKKAMAEKDDTMARESLEMMRKALADWNKAYPMQGF